MNSTAAVMHGLNEIRPPGPAEAVVGVAAVGVCGSDTSAALMVGTTEPDSVKAVIYPNGLPTSGGPR